MDIDIKRTDSGYHVVQFQGELRASDGLAMTERLHPLIAGPEAVMVIDLSQVKWVDSGGLSHLISLVTHSRLSKGRVILADPSAFVSGVLEVTGLDAWFEMVEDVDAALGKLQTGGGAEGRSSG
jgi:anti-anti-sigma factor